MLQNEALGVRDGFNDSLSSLRITCSTHEFKFRMKLNQRVALVALGFYLCGPCSPCCPRGSRCGLFLGCWQAGCIQLISRLDLRFCFPDHGGVVAFSAPSCWLLVFPFRVLELILCGCFLRLLSLDLRCCPTRCRFLVLWPSAAATAVG